MKNIIITSGLLLALVFSACGKKSKSADSLPTNRVELNGSNWRIDTIIGTTTSTSTKLDIGQTNLIYEDGTPYFVDRICFYLIKKTMGRQRLLGASQSEIPRYRRDDPEGSPNFGNFYNTRQHGHEICQVYRIDNNDSANNWIEIVKEEGNYKKVWGRYSMTLFRIENCASGTYPDTIRLRNGEFYIDSVWVL